MKAPAESEFRLLPEAVKNPLRLEMRKLVRDLAGNIEPGTSDATIRRIFRHARPQCTYDSQWCYKVWREEIRRIQGKATGPKAKRVMPMTKAMKSTHDWLRSRGITLTNETQVEPGELTLEQGAEKRNGLRQ